MSMTTTTHTPLDEQARAARREHVRALAESVSQHMTTGTLATDAQAALDLKALDWEVGGMARYVQAQTTVLLGEDDGSHLCCGWFAGTFGEADEARALDAFQRAGVNRLAGRARELSDLCLQAQLALDEVSVSDASLAEGTTEELQHMIAEVEERIDQRDGRIAMRRPERQAGSRQGRRGALAVAS